MIQSIIASHRQNPEAFAIVQGENPGRIFVDDIDSPSAALIWSQGIEGFYLVGNAGSRVFSTQLDAYVQRVIEPEAMKSGLEWFEVSGDRPDWNETIADIFADHTIETSLQSVYGLTDEKYTIDRLCNVDRENVQRICPSLIRKPEIRNQDFLQSKLDRFWRVSDDFFKAGFGYAAVHDRQVVSVCFSAFVAASVHVVDVETTPANRYQGFAKMATAAFLSECLERELQPYWDCMAENNASRGLAESVGLRKVREYMLHSFKLDDASIG